MHLPNVEGARAAGWSAEHFTNPEELRGHLAQYLGPLLDRGVTSKVKRGDLRIPSYSAPSASAKYFAGAVPGLRYPCRSFDAVYVYGPIWNALKRVGAAAVWAIPLPRPAAWKRSRLF